MAEILKVRMEDEAVGFMARCRRVFNRDSDADVIRLALAALLVAADAREEGHTMAVLDSDGKVLKEIKLP